MAERCMRSPVHGCLEVATGPMFSGKTAYLIRQLQDTRNRLGDAVIALKPQIDKRYATDAIVSHSKLSFPAVAISTDTPVSLAPYSDHLLVGIDEIQFFGPWIVDEIGTLLTHGVDVFVSGLDLTFKGEPFGPVPTLLCLANKVHKLTAVCARCGSRAATRTFRKAEARADILVGGAETYEPRCLKCFVVG